MSYDIHLNCEPFETPQYEVGGTYAVGGTAEPWLNITYNYALHFYRVLGGKGIRTIYGMSALESMPVLSAAMDKLDDDVNPNNYWDATEGNAKAALQSLLRIAMQAVNEGKGDALWDGD